MLHAIAKLQLKRLTPMVGGIARACSPHTPPHVIVSVGNLIWPMLSAEPIVPCPQNDLFYRGRFGVEYYRAVARSGSSQASYRQCYAQTFRGRNHDCTEGSRLTRNGVRWPNLYRTRKRARGHAPSLWMSTCVPGESRRPLASAAFLAHVRRAGTRQTLIDDS